MARAFVGHYLRARSYSRPESSVRSLAIPRAPSRSSRRPAAIGNARARNHVVFSLIYLRESQRFAFDTAGWDPLDDDEPELSGRLLSLSCDTPDSVRLWYVLCAIPGASIGLGSERL